MIFLIKVAVIFGVAFLLSQLSSKFREDGGFFVRYTLRSLLFSMIDPDYMQKMFYLEWFCVIGGAVYFGFRTGLTAYCLAFAAGAAINIVKLFYFDYIKRY